MQELRDQVKAGLGGSVSFGLFFFFLRNQHRFRSNLRSPGLEGKSSHVLGLHIFGAVGVSLGRGAVLGVLGRVHLHITDQALIYLLLDTNKPLALVGDTGNPLFPLYPPGSSRATTAVPGQQ